jgi:crotonobetainyl-CoA:carnitine CoA-transferase CaiB-like acyl-CoA transferase
MPDQQYAGTPPPAHAQYVWAAVILTLIGAVLCMVVIKVRPAVDPLVVIGGVMAGLTPTIAAILALMKAQETHLSVNSRLDSFMKEHAINARNEGVTEGLAQGRAETIVAATAGVGTAQLFAQPSTEQSPGVPPIAPKAT